jgi:hypothetical protein
MDILVVEIWAIVIYLEFIIWRLKFPEFLFRNSGFNLSGVLTS